VRCFFDRESGSAEILLPGNSGNQAKTMTSFTLFTHHYPTVCACVGVGLGVCVCVFNWIANSIRNGQICLKHVETKQAHVFLSSHTPRLISHGLWCLCCASLLPLGEVSQVMFLPHSNKPHRDLQYHGEIPCES